MLGRLYITPHSTPEKLQMACDLVAEAIDAKVATDAPTRNALTKLQTALTRAIGDEAQITGRKSIVPEGAALSPVEVESAPPEPEEDVTMQDVDMTMQETKVEDSVLDELLDEDDDDDL
jgi:condensin complex subunit 3